jgi:zinc protease
VTRAASIWAVVLGLSAACGGSTTTTGGAGGTEPETGGDEQTGEREAPPPSGPARDISFPPIVRESLENGLEVNTVESHQLPTLYLRLVVKSGAESDPRDQPGLAHLVGQMLEEGTRRRTSAQLAEEVDFLGASLWVGSDEENVYVGMRALAEHLDDAMAILADVATSPAFRADELAKLKRREVDRLALQSNDPNFLASRELYRALYGDHPYARIDTTPEVVRRVSRGDLVRWHRRHFVPNNAVLVVVGDVSAAQVQAASAEAFGGWSRGTVPDPEYGAPPTRDAREVIVVDRPESVQSVIAIGNLAIERSDDAWVPLQVANQILGGSAASRLFMDLRERRSLTYGAYSAIGESVNVGPFRARSAVRNEVTGQALDAFFEHLERIRTEAPPDEELANARRYISDRFPLQIDTPRKVASLVADLRVFGLGDDYWDTYRSSIRDVGADHALAAAREHITPDSAVVVIVGRASDVVATARRWGPVTVLDTDGEEKERLPAADAAEASRPDA